MNSDIKDLLVGASLPVEQKQRSSTHHNITELISKSEFSLKRFCHLIQFDFMKFLLSRMIDVVLSEYLFALVLFVHHFFGESRSPFFINY